jgi:hypothetical protein
VRHLRIFGGLESLERAPREYKSQYLSLDAISPGGTTIATYQPTVDAPITCDCPPL